MAADFLVNDNLLFETVFTLLDVAFFFWLVFAHLPWQLSTFGFQLFAVNFLADFTLHIMALLFVFVLLRLLWPLNFLESAVLDGHLPTILPRFWAGDLVHELLAFLTLLFPANTFFIISWFVEALLCWDHIAFLAVLVEFEFNRVDTLLIGDSNIFVITIDALYINTLFVLLSDNLHFVDFVADLLVCLTATQNIVFFMDNMVVYRLEQFTLLLRHIKAFIFFVLLNLGMAVLVINLFTVCLLSNIASLHVVRNALVLMEGFRNLMTVFILFPKFTISKS